MASENICFDESRKDNNYTTSKRNDDTKKKFKTKKCEETKKNRLKSGSNSPKDLPILPKCGHCEKGMHCNQLTSEDVANFQSRFYDNSSKVKQDIYILRHCAVSAPKRCRSRDGIQRKSMVVHYYASTIPGNLVAVCRTTFTSLLGIKSGRVQGVVNRYIQSKKIPTENRGGDRHSKKFQRKLQSVCTYLSDLPGVIDNCGRCGAAKKILSAAEDMRKLWYSYNMDTPYDLRVVESYFRAIFTKYFNISFGVSKDKDKDHCYRCSSRKKNEQAIKREVKDDEDDNDVELKILEMSFPPGEHFLFAPIPATREPIEEKEWRSGDELEYENVKEPPKTLSKPQEAKENNGTLNNCIENNQEQHREQQQFCQGSILQNLLIRPAPEMEFHSIDGNHTQHVPSHDMHLHQLSTPQHGNVMNIHHLHHQSLENINYMLQPPHHTLVSPQHVIHSYGKHNLNQNECRDVTQIQTQANLTFNINTNINKDSGTIHLGSHYINLQPASNLSNHQNLHQINISNAGCMKQEYHFMSLSNQHSQHNPNNQEIQKSTSLPDEESLKATTVNKKIFNRCLPCKLTFTSETNYHLHKKRHIESKVLKCEHCGRNFVRTDAFKQHVLTHIDVKPYRCEECGMSFAHRINLDIHSSRHDQTSPLENCQNQFKCKMCLKMFSSKDDLEAHSDWHNSATQLKESHNSNCNSCEIGQRKFVPRESHDFHMKSLEKNSSCNGFGATLPAKEHPSEELSEERSHQCEICGLGFNTSQKMKRHMRTHENGVHKRYECKICDRSFQSPVYLRRHMFTHSNSRPFKCSECPRAFTRQFCLDRHLLLHSSSDEVKSEVCENPDLNHLDKHRKSLKENELDVKNNTVSLLSTSS